MRKLLFFYAPWCRPCHFYEKQFIIPIEERAGPEYIVRVNAQNAPFTAEKYKVDKLPMVILLDGNEAVLSRTGAIDIDKVAAYLVGGELND